MKKPPFRKMVHHLGTKLDYQKHPLTILAKTHPHIDYASECFLKRTGKHLQMLVDVAQEERHIESSYCKQTPKIFEQGLFIANDNTCWIAGWGAYWWNFRKVGEKHKNRITTDLPITFDLAPLTKTIIKKCIVCTREYQTIDPGEAFCDEECEKWWGNKPDCNCFGDMDRYVAKHPKPTLDAKSRK